MNIVMNILLCVLSIFESFLKISMLVIPIKLVKCHAVISI